MQCMQAKPRMMALEIRSSMKAKGRDGHATIKTCVTPPCIFFYGITHVSYDCCMPIPCLCFHAAPYFSCHHHWFCLHLVPVLFIIVIPTSFNILMKCFHTFYIAVASLLPSTTSTQVYSFVRWMFKSHSPTMKSTNICRH